MSVSITNSNASIIFNSGASQIRISKNANVIVKDIGNNVRVEWSNGGYLEYAYTDFSAPTGASAAIVANAVEAFLDPGTVVAENVLAWGNDGTDDQKIKVDSAGELQVDIVSLIPGTGATNLGKAVDAVAGATDTGVVALAKRVNIPAAVTPANGDWVFLQVDANGALWTKRGQVTVKGANKTRPADTTAYTAGDVISESTSAGTGFTVSNVVPISAGGGWFTRIVVRCSKISITPRIRVHIFDSTPANTVFNDNAPATTVYAASITEIATVDLPAMVSGGTNSGSVTFVHDQYINFLLSGTDATVILETLDAFTPASGDTWYVEITSDVY